MTEPTDKPLSDESLDEYLKGDSDVSLQYRRLRSAEVPAELDNLVLRQAEDAVNPYLPERRRPAWLRWSAPLAVAASALVVLSIVVETGQRDETVTMQAPAPVEAKHQRTLERAAENAEKAVPERAARGNAANAPGLIAPAEPAPPPPAPIYMEPKAAEAPAMDVYVPEFVAPASAPRTYTDPEAWLKDIRQLRLDNKQSEADAEWRRFVGAFPNYRVEEDDPAREAK